MGRRSLEQIPIFGDKRQGERLVRECEAIGRRAELDGAAVEALELPEVQVASAGEGGFGRADVAAGGLPQSLHDDGNAEFGVLTDTVPRKAEKVELDNDPFRRSLQFQPNPR